MKHYLFFILFLLVAPNVIAQLPSNPIGLNPYKLKWRQINTDKVQVIFPEGQEVSGQKVANIVHHLWQMPNQSIGNRNKKVSIILQNQTTIPNGFVTVGPYRSEFYLTPPQFNFGGTADWLHTLTVHEYRHVLQFNNARQGVTRLAKNTFGSWAWGGFAGMALPRWYWEGDAVGMETALTRGGRGRMPAFEMEFRSVILENKHYHYEKAGANSLKDFVPDHYNLGYYLTTYARRRFGEDIWQKVLSDAVRYKGIFHPFSRSLRKHTGLRTRDLYNDMRREIDSTWRTEAETQEYTTTKLIKTAPKKTYTDYQNAHFLKDGTVIAEKSGFSQIPTYVRIYTDGKERRVMTPGLNVRRNRTLSVRDGVLCWAELSYDARWLGKDFSIIRTYNSQTGERRKLSFRSRYFAPALSPNLDEIVTVEHQENQQTTLVILNANTGDLKQTLENPEGYFFSQPRWLDEGRKVVVVAQKEEHQHLRLYDLENNTSEALTKPNFHHISNPYAKGDYVYFSGAHTGINNIFAVNTTTKDQVIYQVSNVKVGAFQPSIASDGKTLLMSEFTTKGYELSQISLNQREWTVWKEEEEERINYYQTLVDQEGGSIIGKIKSEEFDISKYNKWQGLINPHSLVPYLFPPVTGLRLLSDNKFSTLSAEIAGYYNQNEDNFTYGASLSYAELFPVINAGFNLTRRSRTLYSLDAETDTTLAAGFLDGEWNERNFYVGLELPFDISQGSHRTRVNFRLNHHWINIERLHSEVAPEGSRFRVLLPENVSSSRLRPLFTTPQRNELMRALDFRFSFIRQQQMARQHINPQFAQIFVMRYRGIIGQGQNQGSVFYALGDLYFPGLFRNHSLVFNAGYQREIFTDNYKFANFFPYPRGYGSQLSDDIFKVGVNYAFPLFYPDMRLGGLLFLKRIKLNLFFDYARTEATSLEPIFRPITNNISSVGGELTFDLRLFRLLEVDLGTRYSYAIDLNDPHQVEFLLLRIGI